MPNFSYIAKSLEGDTVTGNLDANDERDLAQNLKNQGLILIKTNSADKKSIFKWEFSMPFSNVAASEKIIMTRNLEVMFSTGLSLVKSFEILSKQTRNNMLKKALTDIKDKISKGQNLSEAIAQYPKIFSDIFVNMMKVGEESGTLEEAFQILSLQMTKEHELKAKIKNALIYPSIILIVMCVVAAVMVTIVLPSLDVFFTALNVDIPIYTKIILATGRFLSANWYLMLLAPPLFFLFGWLVLKTKPGKLALDAVMLKLPVISSIVKKNNSAFLIRSLSSLISAGVALTKALEIASRTMGNHYFGQAVALAEEKIKKGEKLSNALRPYQNLFPFGVLEMIEVGEETGKTSEILKKLADFYEQEAIIAIEKLTVIIEPILIIVLGLGVGIFALSIIQPMYSSLQFINK
ncbi:MAG: type II secretion system F family protein [Patescibacteria group bacterium]